MTVFSLRAPSAAGLRRLVAEQGSEPLTYEGIGTTADGELHTRYRNDRWEVDLGPDEPGRFERSVAALHHWAPQRGAGMTIYPDVPVEPDLTFALVLEFPLGFVTAAGRVVYMVDTPDCGGFAYGTLPAHPEMGEEAFLIRRHDGRVSFEVIAFSTPRHPLARLGAPVTRLLQLRTNSKYLDAMRRIAT